MLRVLPLDGAARVNRCIFGVSKAWRTLVQVAHTLVICDQLRATKILVCWENIQDFCHSCGEQQISNMFDIFCHSCVQLALVCARLKSPVFLWTKFVHLTNKHFYGLLKFDWIWTLNCQSSNFKMRKFIVSNNSFLKMYIF
jgi:hypothetical protein